MKVNNLKHPFKLQAIVKIFPIKKKLAIFLKWEILDIFFSFPIIFFTKWRKFATKKISALGEGALTLIQWEKLQN